MAINHNCIFELLVQTPKNPGRENTLRLSFASHSVMAGARSDLRRAGYDVETLTFPGGIRLTRSPNEAIESARALLGNPKH